MEFIVASVVMATVLAGVYATFGQSVKVQVQNTRRMNDSETAEAILSELSQAFENVVSQPKASAIKAGLRQPDGAYVICMTSPSTRLTGRIATVAERRRYFWGHTDEGDGMFLDMQRMPFVGPKCIHPLRTDESQSLQDIWPQIKRETIASRFQSLSVRYRAANDPNGQWQEEWKGDFDDVAVWIIVGVGEEKKEAIIIPKVRTKRSEENQ